MGDPGALQEIVEAGRDQRQDLLGALGDVEWPALFFEHRAERIAERRSHLRCAGVGHQKHASADMHGEAFGRSAPNIAGRRRPRGQVTGFDQCVDALGHGGPGQAGEPHRFGLGESVAVLAEEGDQRTGRVTEPDVVRGHEVSLAPPITFFKFIIVYLEVVMYVDANRLSHLDKVTHRRS